MHHKMSRNTMAAIGSGGAQITAGTPVYTSAYKLGTDANQFEEMALLVKLTNWSAAPATPTLKVELQHSDTPATASAYAVPTPVEAQLKQTYGAVADGGGGEGLGDDSDDAHVLFHFSPGKYRGAVRFKLSVATTAGTETVDYVATLIGLCPRDYPAVQIPLTAVVVPS